MFRQVGAVPGTVGTVPVPDKERPRPGKIRCGLENFSEFFCYVWW
jgi:hypothetical protein